MLKINLQSIFILMLTLRHAHVVWGLLIGEVLVTERPYHCNPLQTSACAWATWQAIVSHSAFPLAQVAGAAAAAGLSLEAVAAEAAAAAHAVGSMGVATRVCTVPGGEPSTRWAPPQPGPSRIAWAPPPPCALRQAAEHPASNVIQAIHRNAWASPSARSLCQAASRPPGIWFLASSLLPVEPRLLHAVRAQGRRGVG